MKTKRYEELDAARLLDEIVRFPSGRGVRRERALLARILDAPCGDIAHGPDVERELRSWSSAQTSAQLEKFSQDLVISSIATGFQVEMRLKIGPHRDGAQVVLRVDGDARDVLRFKFISLIQLATTERFRTCECGNPFVKFGRREFCSARCQKRYYMRAKREQERLERERGQGHGKKTRKR